MANVNVEFAKHKHLVILSPRGYGDLDYKQRTNWSSQKRLQRERANLLFSRVYQGLYNLANDIKPTTILAAGAPNEYVYQLSDSIGRIIFKLINTTTESIIYVLDFICFFFLFSRTAFSGIISLNSSTCPFPLGIIYDP